MKTDSHLEKAMLGILIGTAAMDVTCAAAAFDGRLSWAMTEEGLDMSWTSPSLTEEAPFVHYEFQVQQSVDLVVWEEAGALVPGGFINSPSVLHTVRLTTTDALSFVRLNSHLNLPGADLSGFDLSGLDLRGANLAGANLSDTILDGALLGGADLTGAELAGATFAGADLQDVNLDGFDLAGLDLGTILGTPLLTQITADSASNAAQSIPHLPYHSDGRDLVAGDAVVPGIISTRNAMLMLSTNATVGELNALLATHGASIVASSPADETLPNATLMVRFPTSSAQELYDLTVALNEDPIMEAAAPDIQLGLTVVPDDTTAAPTWHWDEAGINSGGNWGLEYARVPQMWNVLGALARKNAARVPICILDDYFVGSHPDLIFAAVSSSPSLSSVLQTSDHGNHVAGIAGATYNNRIGIDGVNPLALLSGFEHRNQRGYTLVQDARAALRQFPNSRILNMSLAYNWYLHTNAARPTITSPFTTEQLIQIQFICAKYGLLMAGVARSSSSVLIVTAAGNDLGLISARLASPMGTAALNFGAPNILVVGSHDLAGFPSAFSNPDAEVHAPGEDILSATALGGAYTNLSGTSMATPFVTGVAGYLMAVDPSLTPVAIKNLIGTSGGNVNAFSTLMQIDLLSGRKDVLRMLLDIDDSSQDGSLRVEVPAASLTRDRSFVEITGSDYTALDGVVGDDLIDMSDFRRWRDWLLFGAGNHRLNGSDSHLKFDANGNGTSHPHDDMLFIPRGDFNGDGKVDLASVDLLPGGSLPRTDLDVLIFSDLWEDPDYTNALVLSGLVDSVDFHVSAASFYDKRTDIDAEVEVSVHDVETEAPLEDGAAILFSPDSSEHVFTVPSDGEYFVASDPIPIGEGTNVVMRSIGNQGIADSQRGADFAVDLALWEMTAVARMLNPETNLIDSRALAKYVEAYIPAGGTAQPEADESVGARAWATNTGTFYAVARAGSFPILPTNTSFGTTWSSTVRWQRSFIKDASKKDPQFLVKPMHLQLGGTGPGGTELNARAEIVVEMRSYDISATWQPVFFYRAEIAGKAALGGNPHTFRIVEQIGDLPDKVLQLNGSTGAEYLQEKYRGQINLEDVPDGHSFEVRYHLHAEIVGQANDNVTLAYIGDPLQYGSGTRMVYGEFGDLPVIDALSIDTQGNGVVSFYSHTNFYYRLYRGADADTTSLPIAMKLGMGGPDSLIDPVPLPGATPEDYTLENQPIGQPLDLDGDGIDDVYELLHPAILDPLEAVDALLDPDGDGRSNLREYLDGTDPEVIDDPPSSAVVDFPGLLIPSYTGGDLVDVNNDGLLDSAVQNLAIALGHLGGTFAEPLTSPLTGMRIVSDGTYLHLDGDLFLDAVLIDQLTNAVFLFRGVGDGTFTALTNHPAVSGPTTIVPCNLNADAWTDIALLASGGADLHINNGDGTMTPVITLSTNVFGSARGLATGDLNGDSQDDVVIGYAFNIVVFLSQPNGDYGMGQPYPVSFLTTESIAIGDLNGDGPPDIVTANRSSHTLSVLIAGAGNTFLPEVFYETSELPQTVRLLDFNGDTFLDALLTHVSKDYHTILPGVGNGTFAAPYPVSAGQSLSAIHDWNGDGHLDLIGPISSSGGLVILGNGDGTFDTRHQIVPPEGTLTQVRPVDFEGDGLLELAGLNTQANSVDVWEHAAVTGENRLLSTTAVGQSVAAWAQGDFNSDGLLDLAVATQTNSFSSTSSNQVVILINRGDFDFQFAGSYPMPVRPTLVVSGDFDGDGALDLAVHIGGGSLNGGSQLVSLLGDGAGGFQAGPPVVVGVVVTFMAAADSDNDLRSDLVLRGTKIDGSSSVPFLDVYAVDAGGSWTNRQSLAFTSSPGSPQVVSVNGDDYIDLAVLQTDSSSGERSLRFYPGSLTGFGPEQVLQENVPFASFNRLTDLNGDGLLDVASGHTLFLANPDGGFHPAQGIWIGAEGIQEVADFNRDGKPDLLNGLSILLQK